MSFDAITVPVKITNNGHNNCKTSPGDKWRLTAVVVGSCSLRRCDKIYTQILLFDQQKPFFSTPGSMLDNAH